MLILALESSCDDLSCALYDGKGRKLQSLVTKSGVASQGRFKGVVPEVAARDHLANLGPVLDAALSKASVTLKDVQGVCATYGPGLIGSLLVGFTHARALAASLGLPFAGVNHLQAHAHAFRLDEPDFNESFLALVVSGGHTDLARFNLRAGDGHASSACPKARWSCHRLASTRDDAAGEAFDKVARLLNLGYPGGPAIEKAVAAFEGEGAKFTVPRMKDGSGDFSFSGLKTAVALRVKELLKGKPSPISGEGRVRGNEAVLDTHTVASLAKGFQETAVKALVRAASKEARTSGDKVLSVGGGVAANSRLRALIQEEMPGVRLKLSPLKYCGDNAAMIALLGAEKLMAGRPDGEDLEPDPGLTIESD